MSNAQNSAQKVLDGVSYLTEAVTSIGAPPTKLLTSWVADKIAPDYWRPNNEIKVSVVINNRSNNGASKVYLAIKNPNLEQPNCTQTCRP